jgi:hypothetical protein
LGRFGTLTVDRKWRNVEQPDDKEMNGTRNAEFGVAHIAAIIPELWNSPSSKAKTLLP